MYTKETLIKHLEHLYQLASDNTCINERLEIENDFIKLRYFIRRRAKRKINNSD